MKRLVTILSAALLAAAVAGPASAAPPNDFVWTNEHSEVDPCTGEEHDVIVTFNIHEVVTRTGLVAAITAEFETSSGYIGRGTNTFRFNNNRISETFTHVLRNPETGAMYRVAQVAYQNYRTEVLYLDETRECVRAPRDA